MSLTEVLDAVKDLTEDEREKVREFIYSLGSEERLERFRRLRGSLEKERLCSLSLEELKANRREIWPNIQPCGTSIS